VERTRERKALVAGTLELWDKLELVFEDRGRTGRYRTRLEDVTDKHLVINRPSLLSGDALFAEGAEFTAYFYKTDSAYAFNGKILGKNPEGLDTYLIPRPQSIDRNQRRRYYRIEVDMPAVLVPADDLLAGKLESDDLPEFEATCLNLSGNGTLCRTRFGADITDKLFVALRVADINREFSFLGVIRRQESKEEGWHNYGIEFFTVEEQQLLLSNAQLQRVPKRYHSFTETHRTTLLNYIFSQQVALKKRGLL
jgi:c-di-GMP-binding flagellar brake protein YcgR